MNNEFQAIIPDKGGRIPSSKPGSTAVIPDGSGFQPLFTALKSVCTPEEPNKCKSPEITVQRDGDRITQICIQCGCGQIIELGCQYPV